MLNNNLTNYDVSEVIANQESTLLLHKHIYVNYKKYSLSRETLKYLEERLHLLNFNWENFVGNHVKLVKTRQTVFWRWSRTEPLQE